MFYEKMDMNLVTVFKDIVSQNVHEEHRAFFVDSLHNLAYGGYRRSWGIGDCLVRYQSEKIEWNAVPGLYLMDSNEFIKDQPLVGARNDEGTFSPVTTDDVSKIFNDTYERIGENGFRLRINPKEALDFIDDAIYGDTNYDRVINIQPFYQTNASKHFVAQLYQDSEIAGEYVAKLVSPQGEIYVRVQKTEEDKTFNFNRAKEGDWVIFEPIGLVNEQYTCRALRPYVPGIRMAVQYFRSGCKMPDSAPYSILPFQQNNGIRPEQVKDFAFLEGQVLPPLNEAPMLTIQLDTFQRAMNALSRFKLVEIAYIDAHSPWVAYGCDKDQTFQIEVVASTLSPYRLGKVITE